LNYPCYLIDLLKEKQMVCELPDDWPGDAGRLSRPCTWNGSTGNDFMQFIKANEHQSECCIWIFNAEGLPDGLSIDTFSGKITGTLVTPGIFNVKITATNGSNDTTAMFVWRVGEASGEPPVIANPGERRNVTGDEVVLQIKARDADDEALTFGAEGLPDGLLIDTNIGKIMGKLIKPGYFDVKITVSDGISSVSVRVAWTVAPGPTRADRPRIVNPGDQTGQVGDRVAL
jgi:hypothetical protein